MFARYVMCFVYFVLLLTLSTILWWIKMNIYIKYSKTKLPWFSRVLRHSARKRGGLILQWPRTHTSQTPSRTVLTSFGKKIWAFEASAFPLIITQVQVQVVGKWETNDMEWNARRTRRCQQLWQVCVSKQTTTAWSVVVVNPVVLWQTYNCRLRVYSYCCSAARQSWLRKHVNQRRWPRQLLSAAADGAVQSESADSLCVISPAD